MFDYLLSENLKIKNTFLSKLTWIMPMLTILLSGFLTANYFQIDSYNWWYVLMLPGTVSLGCALLGKVDGSMKNRAVIALPVDLKKVWIAKILLAIKNLSISCLVIFISAQLGILIISVEGVRGISFINGLIAAILLIITYMWQIPLCMFLGNKIGLFPAIFINLVVNIVASILSVGRYWWAIPFSYPARLMCPVLRILPNGLLAEPGSQTFTPELLNTWVIPFGVTVSLSLFIVITYFTAKWFQVREVK